MTAQIISPGQDKKVLFIISIFLTCVIISYGQKTDTLQNDIRHESSLDLCVFYEPVLSDNFYGINIDFKYYPVKRIATGFCFSFAPKYVDNNFSYAIGIPLIAYFEFGWINQYDLAQSDRIRIGFNLNNGMTVSRLGDDSIKIRQVSGDRGTTSYISKEIATNYFYLLQPGFDISFCIVKNHDMGLHLITKTKYSFVFGNCEYGQIRDFSNFYFALGFSFNFLTGQEE